MNIGSATELFRQLAKDYFGQGTTVIFANQSRSPKPNQPLVTIMLGNPKRPLNPPKSVYNNAETSFYPEGIEMTIDLFTNGADVISNNVVVAKSDSSLDEMYAFKDFLESEYSVDWCHTKDIAVVPTDVTAMTGIVNDTTYQFRSRLIVMLYFTHLTSGTRGGSAD